ncbi:unnamed protein product [Echinostoma caproni]|uniref:Uncharacterized protein n=1 Tax=Echinostoma caproni TaxID=27848 RepID=A0A183AAV0_9TREM|nr:unnamed protein product [Echinostoma caproni]
MIPVPTVLVRERRYRRRDQSRVNGGTGGSHADDVDDAESQEALSIDCAFDGATTDHLSTPRHSSGIGQVNYCIE